MRDDTMRSHLVPFYLRSVTDHKEKINQYHDNVNLNLIDCNLELLEIELFT